MSAVRTESLEEAGEDEDDMEFDFKNEEEGDEGDQQIAPLRESILSRSVADVVSGIFEGSEFSSSKGAASLK